MRKTKMYLVLGLAAAALAMSTCAKPPTEEMDQAREAVERASKDPDAVRYSGALLAKAKESLTNMEAAAEKKRYDEAKTLASEAKSTAEKAITDGRALAAKERSDAEAAVALAEQARELAEKTVSEAKGGPALADLDFDAVDSDMEAAGALLDAAKKSLQEKSFPQTAENAGKARTAYTGVVSLISQAAVASSPKK